MPRGRRASPVSPTSEGEQDDSEGAQGGSGDEPTRTVTHRPGETVADPESPGGSDADEPAHPNVADRDWGWRGDLLLAVMFVSLIVAPVIVYLRPPALDWRVRLLILPMLPGLLLAVVAVWATTRP